MAKVKIRKITLKNIDKRLNLLEEHERQKQQSEIDQLKEKIRKLENEENIINAVRPTIQPAYLTCNPWK